ncbi:MAG TPA: hypothetical protein VG603_02845 [Chitinophagales bacterium]|nr:hypothetical protein [Chitinophagales bacterium]
MKRYLPFFFTLLFIAVAVLPAFSQCAMCAGQVETATNAGSSVALGVNKGVLYIFVMPYLIIGTLAYFWWKGKKNADPAKQHA